MLPTHIKLFDLHLPGLIQGSTLGKDLMTLYQATSRDLAKEVCCAVNPLTINEVLDPSSWLAISI